MQSIKFDSHFQQCCHSIIINQHHRHQLSSSSYIIIKYHHISSSNIIYHHHQTSSSSISIKSSCSASLSSSTDPNQDLEAKLDQQSYCFLRGIMHEICTTVVLQAARRDTPAENTAESKMASAVPFSARRLYLFRRTKRRTSARPVGLWPKAQQQRVTFSVRALVARARRSP